MAEAVLAPAPVVARHARVARHQEQRAAWVFLLPSLLGLVAFLIGPLLASLVLGFTNWQLLGRARFVGLANYERLFTLDPSFWTALGNTGLFTLEYLVLNIVLSLGLAVWIASLAWGRTLFRLVFFLPTFTPLVGSALVWTLIFSQGGIADYVIAWLGLPIPNLLTSQAWAMQAVVIVSLWAGFGYNLLLFGAALDGVPQSYLDAASIDGATPWQRFWRIRLPLISPTLFFGTVMTAITSLQVFDQVYTLTRGGPGSATTTLGFSIYRTGFTAYKMGYASAISWVMFAIIMALTALQLRLQRAWVHYDG